MTFLKWNIVKRRLLKTKLLLHNRKVYLTYGIVLCLVTLTDLQTRHTGLSASAELLVNTIFTIRLIRNDQWTHCYLCEGGYIFTYVSLFVC